MIDGRNEYRFRFSQPILHGDGRWNDITYNYVSLSSVSYVTQAAWEIEREALIGDNNENTRVDEFWEAPNIDDEPQSIWKTDIRKTNNAALSVESIRLIIILIMKRRFVCSWMPYACVRWNGYYVRIYGIRFENTHAISRLSYIPFGRLNVSLWEKFRQLLLDAVCQSIPFWIYNNNGWDLSSRDYCNWLWISHEFGSRKRSIRRSIALQELFVEVGIAQLRETVTYNIVIFNPVNN